VSAFLESAEVGPLSSRAEKLDSTSARAHGPPRYNVEMMRFRFTIREMLVGIVVLAAGLATLTRCLTIEQRYADAQSRYDAAVAKYEAGVGPMMKICAESFILYAAERQRWFRSGEARENQLDRLRYWEDLARSKMATGLFAETGQIRAEQIADDIRSLREEFENTGR